MRIFSPKALHYIKLGCLSQFVILGLLSACHYTIPLTQSDLVGFTGATNERTALVGEKVLRQQGNAADAAVAMLLHQAVLLPSRAGLGSGGICQVLDPESKEVKTLTFLPKKASSSVGMPALPKGASALQSRYGQLSWKEVVRPAYEAAQKRIEVSALLAQDMEQYPKNVFDKKILRQEALANTFQVLMQQGAGSFYKGALGKAIVGEHADHLNEQHYQTYSVAWTDSLPVPTAEGKGYFPNTAAVGRAAPDLWKWARNNAEVEPVDDAGDMPLFADQEIKSASVIAVDADGMVVVCSVSLGSVFGSHIFSKEGGFYLASPLTSLQDSLFNGLWTQSESTQVIYVATALDNRAVTRGVRMAQAILQKGKSVKEVGQSVATADDVVLVCLPNGLAEPALCQGQGIRSVVK